MVAQAKEPEPRLALGLAGLGADAPEVDRLPGWSGRGRQRIGIGGADLSRGARRKTHVDAQGQDGIVAVDGAVAADVEQEAKHVDAAALCAPGHGEWISVLVEER